MKSEALELLRFYKRMRRQHERGESTDQGPALINAAISYCETLLALERLAAADGNGDSACLAAYEAALDAVDALRIEQQRRLASAVREEGIEDWATFLPGFDQEFPAEPEEPGAESETNDD